MGTLAILIALPILGSILLAFFKDAKKGALVSSGAILLLTIVLYILHGGYEIRESHDWIPSLNIYFKLKADGFSLSLILLSALLTFVAILASLKTIDAKEFYISMLVLEAGLIGVFCAADLFLFYVFWEVGLVPMYLIIGIWGGARRIHSAVKFIIYTMAGSLIMLVGIIFVYSQFGTFDIESIIRQRDKLTVETQTWLFLSFAIAFAIKVPLFPFHTWLPDAHTEAPTAGSVILAGVLLKLGAFGFITIAMPFFPLGFQTVSPYLIGLAAVGIIYGALLAMAQGDIKRLIAYSSISHMGFIMLGIFSGNPTAIIGAKMQMINHGLSTGALFLLVGIIYEKTHKRGINDFGGIVNTMPLYATCFMIITLSSIGLPGLNGFVGEFLILTGSFKMWPFAAAVSTIGILLSAVYMLKLYRNMFFGTQHEKISDISVHEFTYLAPQVVLVIVLGIMPGILLTVL